MPMVGPNSSSGGKAIHSWNPRVRPGWFSPPPCHIPRPACIHSTPPAGSVKGHKLRRAATIVPERELLIAKIDLPQRLLPGFVGIARQFDVNARRDNPRDEVGRFHVDQRLLSDV